MSTEVAEVVEKKSEPLFSKKNRKLITNPLDIDNPDYGTGIGYLFCIGGNHANETSVGNGH
jgi:hypothetical protein